MNNFTYLSLQPGIHYFLYPWHTIIVGLLVYIIFVVHFCGFFLTIPFQEEYGEKLAVRVPYYNNAQSGKIISIQYQWKILPWIMLNIPNLCYCFLY